MLGVIGRGIFASILAILFIPVIILGLLIASITALYLGIGYGEWNFIGAWIEEMNPYIDQLCNACVTFVLGTDL